VSVVLLSGGTGGAKLAAGLYEIIGERLTVVANTGDDIEIYGTHVSPDPDLITYWLAGLIDERGWGIAGDSFAVTGMLRELGVDVWFNLGDRDMAVCVERSRLLAQGLTPTGAHARLSAALGVSARILPMSDEPVVTRILTSGAWVPLQEFMIQLGGTAPIENVQFAGAAQATPSEAVLEAIADARVIIIGPSNPVISIGPILALAGMREVLIRSRAPVVAVSPIVGGAVLKGPTAECLRWAGVDASGSGVARYYGDLLDAIIGDEKVAGLRSLRSDTLMTSREQRLSVAQHVLELIESLAASPD